MTERIRRGSFQQRVVTGVLPLLFLWSAAPALAEKAVLLPAQGDESLETERDAAHRVLAEALTGQGVQVMQRTVVAAELSEAEGRACVNVDCAPTLVRAVGADFAAALAVWAGEGDAAASVFVTLVGARGTRFPGQAVVQQGDLPTAVRNALVDARGLQLLGPGPWLRVRGTPEGAQLYLDGRMVGTIPFRSVVSPGRHTLEVRSQNYTPHIQSVDVPPNAARQLDVQVRLPASGTGVDPMATAVAAGEEGQAPHYERPIWGPVLLGAAGAGVLTAALISAAMAGCVEEVEGGCGRTREVDTGATVAWSIAGGAAMAGGLLWHLLGRVEVEPPEAGLSLDLLPTGARLRVRY